MPAGQTHQKLAAQERWQVRDQVFKRALSHAFEQEAIAEKALQELTQMMKEQTQTLKELTLSNRYTMESIRYASLLQRNLLPNPAQWQHKLTDLAVHWQPKDIIGGDIWWMSGAAIDDILSIGLIDCTGHGVPGAMTAILVSNALERQCLAAPGSAPQDYFAAIQQTLSQSFGTADQVTAIDNGCDLLLLQIDRERKTLKLGLGGIGLMLYRRNSQTVQWIESPRSGINAKLESLTRTSGCELSYDAGDRLLFVTDGVTDQIGGPQNPKAYGYRRMQEVFSNSVDSSAAEVVQALEHSVREWQGAQLRRDDVTILCVDL
jgi:serine phosphatase RsbU (regulator of sigma subunit)